MSLSGLWDPSSHKCRVTSYVLCSVYHPPACAIGCNQKCGKGCLLQSSNVWISHDDTICIRVFYIIKLRSALEQRRIQKISIYLQNHVSKLETDAVSGVIDITCLNQLAFQRIGEEIYEWIWRHSFMPRGSRWIQLNRIKPAISLYERSILSEHSIDVAAFDSQVQPTGSELPASTSWLLRHQRGFGFWFLPIGTEG